MGYQIKIIILGDSAVGKTTLLIRYTNRTAGTLTDNRATIGLNVVGHEKMMPDPPLPPGEAQEEVTFGLWDTAGQERFATLSSAYYRGASCVIFVFSAVDINSLKNLSVWVNKFTSTLSDDENPERIPMVFIRNKMDAFRKADPNTTVSDEMAKTEINRIRQTVGHADWLEKPWFDTEAQSPSGQDSVDEAFDHATALAYEYEKTKERETRDVIVLNEIVDPYRQSGCCSE